MVPRENERAVMRDNYSPQRRELRNVLNRLRTRYGRRRVFRVRDVEEIVMELRYPDLFPERLAPDTPPQTTPVRRVPATAPRVDLTEVDQVIE